MMIKNLQWPQDLRIIRLGRSKSPLPLQAPSAVGLSWHYHSTARKGQGSRLSNIRACNTARSPPNVNPTDEATTRL